MVIVLPGPDKLVKRLPRAGRRPDVSMTEHLEVRRQLVQGHCAVHQAEYCCNGCRVGDMGGVVAHDGEGDGHVVPTQCVGPDLVPAPALVDTTVLADKIVVCDVIPACNRRPLKEPSHEKTCLRGRATR